MPPLRAPLLVTRVVTVALTPAGLARGVQARSAVPGAGFATAEVARAGRDERDASGQAGRGEPLGPGSGGRAQGAHLERCAPHLQGRPVRAGLAAHDDPAAVAGSGRRPVGAEEEVTLAGRGAQPPEAALQLDPLEGPGDRLRPRPRGARPGSARGKGEGEQHDRWVGRPSAHGGPQVWQRVQ